MATITIADDFDLKKIADSGQCFRVAEIKDGLFRFITGENILYIRQVSDNEYEINCSESDFHRLWDEYFDLGRNYSSIRELVPDSDIYMAGAADCGEGIRILKQDPWEMLISFIISQRKSIPAIKTSIEMVCERYGKCITTEYEKLYTFPSPADIVGKTADIADPENSLLSECKLGYRLKYVACAVRAVYMHEIDLEALYELDSDALLAELKNLYGVGEKVANCIALFAYARVELAPVDTWIRKVMDMQYGGENPFIKYGSVAGIMQQYIFYYAQTHKSEF